MAILETWAYSTPTEKATAESAARLRQWYHEKEKGTNGCVVLIREWPFMDKRSADDFAAALTDSVTDPKADNQTFSGTFVSKKPVIMGDDAPTVVQTLVKPDTDGFSITYAENTGVTRTEKYYWDLTKAQYDAIVTGYTSATATKMVIIGGPNINRNGLIDCIVTERTFNDLSVSAYTAMKDRYHTATREVFSERETDPKDELDGVTVGSLTYQKNTRGTYDGVKWVRSLSNNVVFVPVTALKERRLVRVHRGEWQVFTYTYAIGYYAAAANAALATHNGFDGSGYWKVYSSPWGDVWCAKNVYKIEVSEIINKNAVNLPDDIP